MYASAAPAGAQDAAVCPQGRIADVVIDNHSVFDLEDPSRSGRFEWAYRLANALHMRTEAEVIDREILVQVGDCYDVEQLRDSERLLRGFEFLASAEVYGIRMPDGQVQVIVDTQDEWSTRIEPKLSSNGSVGLRGVHLVEANLMGTGRHLGLYYDREEEDGERVYGGEYRTPQLFRSRWNMGLGFSRTEVGHGYDAEFTYPFVGETGRFASRHSVHRSERYFEILMPDAAGDLERVWIPVRREQFEVGGAFRRSGSRFRHTLFGAAVAGERISYPLEPTFPDSDVALLAAPAELESQWLPVSSVRLMLLTGQRNVWFVRRRGIETVNGIEDVQLGVEAEATIGPTIPVVSEDRDIAVGIGLFAAGEAGAATLVGGQFYFQGRRSYETLPGLPEWHDSLAELDVWAHYRPHLNSRHAFVATVSGVGGWHERVPFQLTLGGDSGLRGYPRHVDPGGKRVVASLEHRAYLGGPFADLFDLGSVAFVDVGKIWPGDVAFGTESPIRTTIGAGIRAAFPPGSRQTLRIDVGVPADRSSGFGSVSISVGIGQALGRVTRDPQLLRSMRYNLESADFVHPASRP